MKTIGKVVSDFRQALEGAQALVFDNNSTDDVEVASELQKLQTKTKENR
jgi:hypothetical protein